MPLVTFDDRRVGIHALIVGVSDYTYLPGDDDPPDARKFGMKKLKAPSFGAFRFLQWLKTADREARLAQPLASYDVVLAPSVEEKTVLGMLTISMMHPHQPSFRRHGTGASGSPRTRPTLHFSIFRDTAYNGTKMMPS